MRKIQNVARFLAYYVNVKAEPFIARIIIAFTHVRILRIFPFLSDSSSGCLQASTHQGAIDVYVSQLGKVQLKSHKGQPAGMLYF
jgi:hypothetical protein